MSDPLDRPRVRPGLAAARDGRDPHVIILFDEVRLSRQPVRLSPRECAWVQMFDGQQTLRDIQAAAMLQAGGHVDKCARRRFALVAAEFEGSFSFQKSQHGRK